MSVACVSLPTRATQGEAARDSARVSLLQDSIKKLRDKLADQQRMMKLAEAQVDKVKRLETEIQRIKDAKVSVPLRTWL